MNIRTLIPVICYSTLLIFPNYSWATWGDELGGGVSRNGNYGHVTCVTQFQGDLIVGGLFDLAGTTTVTNVARWNGVSWSAMGDNLLGDEWNSPPVENLSVIGGQLIATGNFRIATGAPTNAVARWSGTAWEPLAAPLTSPLALDCQINAIIQYDGTIFIGGDDLDTAQGSSMARWNGSGWTFLPTVFHSVRDMEVLEGWLFAVGTGSSKVSIVAKMDMGEGTILASGGGFTDLCAHNGSLYLGGQFNQIEGQDVHMVGRWTGSSWEQAYSGTLDEGFWYDNGPGEPSWANCYVSRLHSIGETLYVGGLLSGSSVGAPSGKIAIAPNGGMALVGGRLGLHVGWGTIWPMVEVFGAVDGQLIIAGDFNRAENENEILGGMIGLPVITPVPENQPNLTVLNPPAPNPFNPQTLLRVDLAQDGPLRLEIFDLRGRSVKVLMDGISLAGPNDFYWDGSDQMGRPAPSGIYFAKFRDATGAQFQKLLLAK